MIDRDFGPGPDVGDAAWAQNRWPAIGLCAGIGIAVVLGVVFWAGWLKTVGWVVGLAVAGCLCGFVAAKLVYSGVQENRRP